MSAEQGPVGIYPVLAVSDYEAAKTYYVDTLGFTFNFEFGTYGAVSRGAVQIHIAQVADRAGKGACYITLSGGVDEVYAEVTGKGAIVAEPLGDREYGMRDFYINDPEGNSIGFGAELTA